jgi:ABC-type oligopeptide transport system substrate-binding subunit
VLAAVLTPRADDTPKHGGIPRFMIPADDGNASTFSIRNDVKWHDGSPLTA